MPARILSLPFVLTALVFLYLTWEIDQGYSLYLIAPVLILALIYTMSPQINWWWYSRRPPELDAPLRKLLAEYTFYQSLPAAGKQRFRERVALYMMGHEFMPQGMEQIPEDVKCAVAAGAVTLTLGQEDFLLEPFEQIILYPRPFPSPQYPEHFHASEIYTEDGVLLFSVEQLMLGFLSPRQYYYLGLHEFSKVYVWLHPDAPWPEFDPEIWSKLEKISGFSREALSRWINLPPEEIPAQAVAISYFFLFPEDFREALPEVYEQLAGIFGQRPGE